MYVLAINEIRHSKLRYALVTGVMFLIAYLVFFLTGLAYGLAQENRTAVDKWSASEILLAEEANNNLNMSMIPRNLYDEVKADEKAVLAQTAGVITRESGGEKVDVSFLGSNQINSWLLNSRKANFSRTTMRQLLTAV